MSAAIIGGVAQALPLRLLAQAVPMLSRHELAALTERLIERLDLIDGEADFEDDDADEEPGDLEETGHCGEQAIAVYDNDSRQSVGVWASPNFIGQAPRIF